MAFPAQIPSMALVTYKRKPEFLAWPGTESLQEQAPSFLSSLIVANSQTHILLPGSGCFFTVPHITTTMPLVLWPFLFAMLVLFSISKVSSSLKSYVCSSNIIFTTSCLKMWAPSPLQSVKTKNISNEHLIYTRHYLSNLILSSIY